MKITSQLTAPSPRWKNGVCIVPEPTLDGQVTVTLDSTDITAMLDCDLEFVADILNTTVAEVLKEYFMEVATLRELNLQHRFVPEGYDVTGWHVPEVSGLTLTLRPVEFMCQGREYWLG